MDASRISTMNCYRGNYCTDMIKLIGVFDKVLSNISLNEASCNNISDTIINELASVDTDELPCPICGNAKVEWEYKRSRKRSFIWEDPTRPILTNLPVHSYKCFNCGASGDELLSDDIAVPGTILSYHYLFHLFEVMTYKHKISMVERDNKLYERMSEESLKRWRNRFHQDFPIVQSISGNISESSFLSEQMIYGDIFLCFFKKEHRFFLQGTATNHIMKILFKIDACLIWE